jgi:hypothetical protein
MAGAPSPDGRHDDLEADELEGLALLVPDDPRSLEGDRLAYLRELRARRGNRWTRLAESRFPGTGLLGTGLAGPAILVLLVVVGLVGSTLSVFGGTPTPARTLVPLATATAMPVGQVGGLLPDAKVTVGGSILDLRTARPAVLALVPTTCDDECGNLLAGLRAQANEYGLAFALAGPPSQKTELDTVAREALAGTVRVVVDGTDALRQAYGPAGVTLILIHSDGIVAAVDRDVQADQHLESSLVQLDSPGASST